MKFVSVLLEGVAKPGLLQEDEIVLLADMFGDLRALVEAGDGAKERAAAAARDAGRTRVARDGATLGPPIGRFNRDILCTGWNYWDHFEENKGRRDGQEVDRPTAPSFFPKSPYAIIGPTDDIAYDGRLSKKWDYEAELAFVIGKAGRSIPQCQAMEHIFGFCLANDISQRDLQRRHGGQWMKGKSTDGTAPLGPWLVTPDELDLPNLRLECRLNGEVMQSAVVAQMAFSIAEIIAELSFGMTLYPGDVILTGTPAGVGNGRTPQVFLKAGDEVVVSGTGLGELRNVMTERDLAGESDIRP